MATDWRRAFEDLRDRHNELLAEYDKRGHTISGLRSAHMRLYDLMCDAALVVKTRCADTRLADDLLANIRRVQDGEQPTMHNKQHYEATARIIRSLFTEGKLDKQRAPLDLVAHEFASMYAAENKSFRASTFLKACGVIDHDTYTMLKASGK